MTHEFDIIDHPLVLLWFINYAKVDPLSIDFLTQGNINLFKRHFGPSKTEIMKFQVWMQQHSGIFINIYSSESSTIYKIKYLGSKENFLEDHVMSGYIIDFLEDLLKKIKR